MKQPVFSIIIPMYNVEQYIKRCLQSVFDQDILISKYEILLINDGSPDDSEQIARAYCAGRPNIKIISQNNKGLGGARNTGIEHATGEYLLFLDSDDWLLPNALRKLCEFIDGSDIMEFSVLVKDDHKTLHTIAFENINAKSGVDYLLENKTINSACNKIYRRAFLTANDLVFKERIYGEDIQFNSRAFYLTKKIKSISEHLIVFYQSEDSITRSSNISVKRKYLGDLQEVIISLNEFQNKYPAADDRTGRYFYQRIASLTVNSILFGLKNKIPLPVLKKFIVTLKKQNIYNLKYPIKERDFYRLLFKNALVLNSVLFINTLRK